MFPPLRIWNVAPTLPTIERERTDSPRASPITLTIRWPGTSLVVTTSTTSPTGQPEIPPAKTGRDVPARFSHSTIFVTTPAPTVRPPSRIANRTFSSIAIADTSSMSTDTLSPGITISVPSGSFTVPVTSVVRK